MVNENLYGIILEKGEKMLLDIDIGYSTVPIFMESINPENMHVNALWFRPFDLFNYLYASVQNSGRVLVKVILSGKLIVTTKRIIILEQQGLITSKLVLVAFIDLKLVRAINSSTGLFGQNHLLITYEKPTSILNTMEFTVFNEKENLRTLVDKFMQILDTIKQERS